MAADNLALLFRLRGDASGVRTASAEARAAVQQLRQSFGPELSQTVSVTQKAFNQVGTELASFATQRVPVVGGALSRLTDSLRSVGVESKTTERSVNNVANSIASIAQQSGRSIPQVAQFLSRFVQLGSSAQRNEAAFREFGGSVDLIGNRTARFIPELESASRELQNLGTSSAAAGGRLAALAGPISAAVIAVAALVAGLILAGKALFDLSRRTAEFQGRMQDLSQSTGLAVESLSALEVAVTTTGGSQDSIAASIGIFQRRLEEAEDPASKAADLFERLGVQVEDTESTLRSTLSALARMPEGFQQTTLALELFGRGGRQVLAILKETNGDLDALETKLREAGVLITGDAARAADQFNDELALLDFQTRAVSAALVQEFIPAFTELIKSTNEVIKAVTPLIKLLTALAGTDVVVKAGLSVISDSLKGLGFAARAATLDFKGLRQAIKEASEEKFPTIAPIDTPAPTLPAPPQLSQQQEALSTAQLAADALAIVRRAANETNQRLNEAFERGRIDRQKQVDDIIDSNRRILKADQDRIDAEIKGEENKFTQIRNRRDLAESERIDQLQQVEGRVRKLQQERLSAESLFETTSRELRARAAKERADSLRNEEQNRERIFLGETDREIKRIEARIAAGTQVEESGLRLIEQLEQAKIDERRRSLEEQKRIGFLTVQNQKDIDAQVQQLNQDADRLRDEQQARREQRERERAARSRQAAQEELQTLLQLEQIKGESIIASIQAQAALRIRTEESAAREILRVRLQLIDDEIEVLRAQERAATTIPNEQERLRALAELNAQIRILTAQRAAIVEEGNREVEDARQQDLANEREYAEDLREVQERVVQIQRDATEEAIRLMVLRGARLRDVARAQRDLELAEESDRHQRAIESLRRRQQETDAEIRLLERRLERIKIGTSEEIEEYQRLVEALETLRQKRAELDAEQEAENLRSQTRRQRITLETNLELADPDLALRDVFNEIGQAVTDLAARFADLIGAGKEFAALSTQIAQQLGGTLAGAFDQFAQALGQTVANWVLLGQTGPAVMRKILAQALASIAAEATVQAIKQAALGFATLFFNPAESAAHFTAAGLWASIAGASAIAGRGIAGNLFQQPNSGTGDGAGSRGSSQRTGERDPIDLAREGQRDIHVYFHTEPGPMYSQNIIRTVVDDVRNNGDSRSVMKEVAEG